MEAACFAILTAASAVINAHVSAFVPHPAKRRSALLFSAVRGTILQLPPHLTTCYNTRQVIKEERRLARDKAAYARIRQAYASTTKRPAGAPAALSSAAAGPAGLGLGGGQLEMAPAARRAAAGAVAAAARELRPVELVGLYETQKEEVERELAAAKAEVSRLSCIQLEQQEAQRIPTESKRDCVRVTHVHMASVQLQSKPHRQ
jgi:hypothetical protein